MKKLLTGIMALGLATSLSSHANAAGFYLQEQSVSGLGAAFAGQAAMPRDASIITFNPAGMTYLDGTRGNLGVHLLKPRSDVDNEGTVNLVGGYEDSDNPYSIEAVPNGFLSHQLTDRAWVGVSLTAPFGLANKYDKEWFGRYDSISTDLKVFDLQPSAAYKVNDKLSIGGGMNIEYVDADLYSAAGLAGRSRLQGDDISFGYNLGMMYQIDEANRVGLHYKSQVNHKLDGEVIGENTGTALDGINGAKANLNLPDIATLGYVHQYNEKLALLGGVTWYGWGNFERITAITDSGIVAQDQEQNYRNTWAFSVGAEYEYSPEWTFRGGLQYDQTPTQDGYRTTRTPDGDRTWLTAGATYNVNERMSIDMAAAYIDIAEEDINLERTAASTIDANSSGNVVIMSFGLNYKF